MLDSPYFAAITFQYEEEPEDETYYIGIGDFSPSKMQAPLVCDWRAPISSLFYDYDIGKASFQAPVGEVSGELKRKFQFKTGMHHVLNVTLNNNADKVKVEIGGEIEGWN